jgi:hypothetical protein
LSLALGGGRLAQVGMARAEMDVGGVKQSEHPVGGWPPCPVTAGATSRGGLQPAGRRGDRLVKCERGAP